MWPHLYHDPHHLHVGISHGHEDSPSLISSNSESSVPHSPPHHSHTHSHRLCFTLSPPHYSSAVWSTMSTTSLQLVLRLQWALSLVLCECSTFILPTLHVYRLPSYFHHCPWGPGGHGSPSWAWQQVGCEDDAEFLQGIFLFLEVVESLFMCLL